LDWFHTGYLARTTWLPFHTTSLALSFISCMSGQHFWFSLWSRCPIVKVLMNMTPNCPSCINYSKNANISINWIRLLLRTIRRSVLCQHSWSQRRCIPLILFAQSFSSSLLFHGHFTNYKFSCMVIAWTMKVLKYQIEEKRRETCSENQELLKRLILRLMIYPTIECSLSDLRSKHHLMRKRNLSKSTEKILEIIKIYWEAWWLTNLMKRKAHRIMMKMLCLDWSHLLTKDKANKKTEVFSNGSSFIKVLNERIQVIMSLIY